MVPVNCKWTFNGEKAIMNWIKSIAEGVTVRNGKKVQCIVKTFALELNTAQRLHVEVQEKQLGQ